MRASPSLRSPTTGSSPRMVLLAVVTVAASCDYADRPVAPPEYNSAAGEGLKGTIAFDSRRDGNTEIYSMNANGTGVTRLTNNVTTDEAPAWSPNGMQIVFDSFRGGSDDIYIMNADGTGVTQLTNRSPSAVQNFEAAWCGKQIAFSSQTDPVTFNYDIYVMNADGTGVTRLTNNADAIRPAWSPTCKQIAFASDRDTPPFDEIYVMNADGTGITRLTNNNAANDDNSAWSPNGSQIAFDSDRDTPGFTEVYVMNADGTGVTRLTNNLVFEDRWPAWSSDGKQIAFQSNRDGNREIYAMNADGTGVTRLTNNVLTDALPAWTRH